ncbi:hypothetical protein [Rhizobium sp. LEGMi135b]
MPDKYFVYTIIFSRTAQNSVRFIAFQKRAKGYFFSGRRTIVTNGADLHGATKFALPGGKFEGRDWADNDEIYYDCSREFTEECGRQISIIPDDEIGSGSVDDEDEVIDARLYLTRQPVNIRGTPSIKGYAAMYVKVDADELQVVADYIAECFTERDGAVAKIRRGEWRAHDYARIARTFPLAPMDDELDLADPAIREIAQGGFDDDPLIQTLSGDSDTDWFAQIIRGLETIDV